MKIKNLILSLLMITYVTSSYAKPLFIEPPRFIKIGKTDITEILFFNIVDENIKIVFGLNKNNELLKQTICFLDKKPIDSKTEVIYTFDKSINVKKITLSNKFIAYNDNGKIYLIDINSDEFKTKIYDDNIFKKSKILNIRIFNGEVNVFCKQNKNDYFIYKLKTKERIDFNFSIGTIINDFYFYKNCYYVSGYIKDPFLSDQYAYFTKTDQNGKMIYEKQIGNSEDKSKGFTIFNKFAFISSNKESYYQYISENKSSKSEFSENLIDAKSFNIENKNIFIAVVGNELYYSDIQPHHSSEIELNSISFKNDTINSVKIGLIEDKKHPFLFQTKDKFKKGDAFQVKVDKIKEYNFVAISFSDDGKILKYFPKKNSYINENNSILMPSKDTKFDKLNNGNEYLLLLYYKGIKDFIEENNWTKTTINNLKLYLSLKNIKVNYNGFENGFSEKGKNLELIFNNQSIVPLLIKINGQK